MPTGDLSLLPNLYHKVMQDKINGAAEQEKNGVIHPDGENEELTIAQACNECDTVSLEEFFAGCIQKSELHYKNLSYSSESNNRQFDGTARGAIQDTPSNPVSNALHRYFENRQKINNLYNLAQSARDWLQSVFCDADFVQISLNGILIPTKRPEYKYHYAIYRLPDITELVVIVDYKALWNSIPGEARLRFYLEPSEPWLTESINDKTQIRKMADTIEPSSKNVYKRCWHCGSMEINVPEESLHDEEKLKDYLIKFLRDPESHLIVAAKEISALLSKSHMPSYLWEDALHALRHLAPRENEDNRLFWCFPIEYKSFDQTSNIVVLEVMDNLFRDHIERNYNACLSSAVKYAFGHDAKYSIMCRQLMF